MITKSPIYYTGNKFKILPQILSLFPENITTFVDLFGGSGTVLLNVKADHYVYNELNKKVVELFSLLATKPLGDILSQCKEWGLDDTNKDAYIKARQDYNNEQTPVKLFVLICHSFSNQIRFNKSGGFNLPFGKRTITKQLMRNFILTDLFFEHNDVSISNESFDKVPIDSESFVYCDPPYLNSCATYNEGGGWGIGDEHTLRCHLQNMKNKWALSNDLSVNTDLSDWADNNGFVVHKINANYSSCNYQRVSKITDEVLITNY